VEILVAQVGADADADEMFVILYDGVVMDKAGFTVLGGQADAVATVLEERYQPDLDLGAALRLGASVLAGADGASLPAEQLEVAILDRHRPRRAFRRIKSDELTGLLAAS